MREKPLGIVLTILAVLAVGAAPAALVEFAPAESPAPRSAAPSGREESRRDRAQSCSCGACAAGEICAPVEARACACVQR
jgi:hypothetical protein